MAASKPDATRQRGARNPLQSSSYIPTSEDTANAMHAGRIGSWMHLVDKQEVWGDRTVADLLKLDFNAQPWSPDDFFNVIHPDDIAYISQAIDDAFTGKTAYYDVQVRRNPSLNPPDETEDFWIGGRAEVTQRDADGNPLRIDGVNWDVSDLMRVEQRLTMLAAEMDHRVKNAFAVIRSMISLGAQNYPDAAPFAETLRNQVEAMATAHTLSARMARQQREARALVALRDVIETALAPWIHKAAPGPASLSITCDPSIRLQPAKVAAFAMMLYELSTNATKHGTLGTRGGTLSISVEQMSDAEISFQWEEVFETPATKVEEGEAAKGFGEMLLQHTSRNLGAPFTKTLTAEGLTFVMDIPVKA